MDGQLFLVSCLFIQLIYFSTITPMQPLQIILFVNKLFAKQKIIATGQLHYSNLKSFTPKLIFVPLFKDSKIVGNIELTLK